MIGEAAPLLPMTAFRAAAAGGRHSSLLATGVLRTPYGDH